MPKNTLLSTNYTVEQYENLVSVKPPNKAKIADFFIERFTERYITPIRSAPKNSKHGFCTMAVSCLMIEALESFWDGLEETPRGKGACVFCKFFDRCKRFHSLRAYARQFYTNVRCGILHQGETTGGWTVHRGKNGKLLFDANGLTINATKFHDALSQEVVDYANLIKSDNCDPVRWKNFCKKMNFICGHSSKKNELAR